MKKIAITSILGAAALGGCPQNPAASEPKGGIAPGIYSGNITMHAKATKTGAFILGSENRLIPTPVLAQACDDFVTGADDIRTLLVLYEEHRTSGLSKAQSLAIAGDICDSVDCLSCATAVVHQLYELPAFERDQFDDDGPLTIVIGEDRFPQSDLFDSEVAGFRIDATLATEAAVPGVINRTYTVRVDILDAVLGQVVAPLTGEATVTIRQTDDGGFSLTGALTAGVTINGSTIAYEAEYSGTFSP